MSFSGFKKQLNKANQFVSEKLGSAEATKMEDEFVEMERKTDAVVELKQNLTTKTKEFLQPNAAFRAKQSMHMTQPDQKYPQNEGLIGDVMLKAGQDIGANGQGCDYASALLDLGSSLIEIAESRDTLDSQVHQNLLAALDELEEKEIKELQYNRKKLNGRRLDFDCKKRKGNKISIEEVKTAEYKFEESKALCKEGMTLLLADETKLIDPLLGFVVDMLQYHKTATMALEDVLHKLNNRKQTAAAKLRQEEAKTTPAAAAKTPAAAAAKTPAAAAAKTPEKIIPNTESGNDQASAKDTTPLAENTATSTEPKKAEKPCCKAKFYYKAKNDEELSFSEGEMIMLSSKLDGDWFEGTKDGKFGKFPSALVQIITDLPPAEEKE